MWRGASYPFPEEVPYQLEYHSGLGRRQILEGAHMAMLVERLVEEKARRNRQAKLLTSVGIVCHDCRSFDDLLK